MCVWWSQNVLMGLRSAEFIKLIQDTVSPKIGYILCSISTNMLIVFLIIFSSFLEFNNTIICNHTCTLLHTHCSWCLLRKVTLTSGGQTMRRKIMLLTCPSLVHAYTYTHEHTQIDLVFCYGHRLSHWSHSSPKRQKEKNCKCCTCGQKSFCIDATTIFG